MAFKIYLLNVFPYNDNVLALGREERMCMVRGYLPKWSSKKKVLRLGPHPGAVLPDRVGRSVPGERPTNMLALRIKEERLLYARWLCGGISWISLANTCKIFSWILGRRDS